MNQKNSYKYLLPLALSAPLTMPAGDDTSTGSSGWEFQLSPLFLWGMSINGDSQIGTVGAPLDLNFRDGVLENLDAVFTVHFEAKKDKWMD